MSFTSYKGKAGLDQTFVYAPYIPIKVAPMFHSVMGLRMNGLDTFMMTHTRIPVHMNIGKSIIENFSSIFRSKSYSSQMHSLATLVANFRPLDYLGREPVESFQEMLLLGPEMQATKHLIKHAMIFDSTNCGSAYVLNIDDETLEIYDGWQQEHHNKGRYSQHRSGSIPCALVATIPLIEMASIDLTSYMIDVS